MERKRDGKRAGKGHHSRLVFFPWSDLVNAAEQEIKEFLGVKVYHYEENDKLVGIETHDKEEANFFCEFESKVEEKLTNARE